MRKTKNNKGITLIALIITIIVLLILASVSLKAIKGKDGILNDTKYAKYSVKIRDYQTELNEYITTKEEQSYAGEEVRIYAETPEEIKKIIKGISDEDAEKFVIQDNELRYNDGTTTAKEKEWLGKIGILVMTTIFTISFMGKDQMYKTIRATQVEFPRTPPVTDGMDFAGWYYDTELTSEAVEGEKLTADVTLYPKWEAQINSATYMIGDKVFAKVKGNTIKFPSNEPTKENRKFTGWYYDEACTNQVKEGDTITRSIKVYSNWSSYITNKLDGAYFYWETGGGVLGEKYGDAIWHKVNNQDEYIELKNKYSESVFFEVIDKYPSYVKIGGELWGATTKEKIYQYTGSSKITNVTIKENTTLSGKAWEESTKYKTKCEFANDGNIMLIPDTPAIMTERFVIECTFEDGTTDTDYFFVWTHQYCLAKGTKITLANYTTKNIEDITYEDQLLVWDFDNGCFSTAKPLWIKKVQEANEYNYIKFEDGRELKTVVDHRIFNMDSQRFTYTMNEQDTPLGTRVFLEDGTTTRITEREVIHEKIEYYNIITDYHMNLFANGILTSLRLNNLYEIKDMKFIKDDRELVKREEYKNIPDKYFNGLRLAEQPKEINKGNDVKHTNTLEEYVQRIINMEK